VGESLSYENTQIEELQQVIARQYGFHLQTHKMELYGLCKDCQDSND